MHELRLGQCPDRDHAALRIADINLIDVVDIVPKRRFRLHVDLPRAAEHVEVVDVEAPQRRLQGVEDVADLDAEHLRLVAIDIEVDLRRVGGIRAVHAGKLGFSIGRYHQAAQCSRDIEG